MNKYRATSHQPVFIQLKSTCISQSHLLYIQIYMFTTFYWYCTHDTENYPYNSFRKIIRITTDIVRLRSFYWYCTHHDTYIYPYNLFGNIIRITTDIMRLRSIILRITLTIHSVILYSSPLILFYWNCTHDTENYPHNSMRNIILITTDIMHTITFYWYCTHDNIISRHKTQHDYVKSEVRRYNC